MVGCLIPDVVVHLFSNLCVGFRNTVGHITILDNFCIENNVSAFDKGNKLLKFIAQFGSKLSDKGNEISTFFLDDLARVFNLSAIMLQH